MGVIVSLFRHGSLQFSDTTLNGNHEDHEHESRVSTKLAPRRTAGRRPKGKLFGLIIGINKYASVPELRGAVSDAQKMEEYLRKAYDVPKKGLRTLHDTQATRDNIIRAFKKLCKNNDINKNDRVVIFYAGYGGRLPTPQKDRGSQKTIYFLVPQDYNPPTSEWRRSGGTFSRLRDPSEDLGAVHPIRCRTIGAFVDRISKSKTKNITVIFDCCFSAAGARGNSKRPRAVNLYPISAEALEGLDKYIWRNFRGGKIPDDFVYTNQESYMLLTACKADELADEDELAGKEKWNGHFTNALLAELHIPPASNLTYTELIGRLRLRLDGAGQTPQCVGHEQHRILFETKVLADLFFGVTYQSMSPCPDPKNKYVFICAGLAHGILEGVQFTLYRGQSNEELAVVEVDGTSEVNESITTIITPVDIPDGSFTRLTRVSKLSLQNWTPGLEEPLRQMIRDGANFKLEPNESEAELAVALRDGQAILKILDPQLEEHGLKELPYKIPLDDLNHVLNTAAHYFWCLDFKNQYSRTEERHDIGVTIHLLKEDPNNDEILLPDPSGAYREQSGVIEFFVEPDALYGLEIINNTNDDLYMKASLFNNDSLQIVDISVPYCTKSCDGAPEPLLKRGEPLTIGYGSGEGYPLRYSLEEGQDVDIGYMKIFFATDLANLPHTDDCDSPVVVGITQDRSATSRLLSTGSELMQKAGLPVRGNSRAGGPVDVSRMPNPGATRFAIQILVVQKRKKETE